MKPIHKIGPFTVFAGVTSLCGCAMQQHNGRRFSNRVNYWGKIGIRIEQPLRILTLDDRDVTCLECIKLLKKKKTLVSLESLCHRDCYVKKYHNRKARAQRRSTA